VLQLLAEHPLRRVQQAVEACKSPEETHAERIAAMVQRLAEKDGGGPVCLGSAMEEIQVPKPDLGRFDDLLKEGEEADGK
jgi:hypothetical protein